MNIIFHLDMDSYFVSAARTVNPELIGKSIGIGGQGRRSILSSISYEAKAKGIYVAIPVYKAKKLDPEIIIIPPDFDLYTSLSNKIFELISNNFTKKIEVSSIDECYIDVTNIWKEYGTIKNLAKKMQETIMRELNLPASIGISTNKFVAKMSTSVNKPCGITITKESNFLKVFQDESVQKIHGIGGPTALSLKKLGIEKIGELAAANEKVLYESLGVRGKVLKWNANGYGDDILDLTHNELKGIGNSITFQWGDKTSKKEITEVLRSLSNVVATRADNRNMVGHVVSVAIKASGGKEVKATRKQVTLHVPIGTADEIIKVGIKIFDELWNGKPVKFIGIHLAKLSDKFNTTYQSSIYDEKKKVSSTEQIISNVNRKFKNKVVISGVELRDNEKKKQNQSRYLESDRLIKK